MQWSTKTPRDEALLTEAPRSQAGCNAEARVVLQQQPASHPVLVVVRRRDDGLLPPPAPRGALRIDGTPRVAAAAATAAGAAVVGAVVLRRAAGAASPRGHAVALPLVLITLILRQVLPAIGDVMSNRRRITEHV